MKTAPQRRRPGLTLLEVLAVITILFIIAAVVVPRFTNLAVTSRSNVAAHHIEQLNALVERHHREVDAWPTDLYELVTEGYLDAVPSHPDPTKMYLLNTTSNHVEESAAP